MTIAILTAMPEEGALYRDACAVIGTINRAGLSLHRATYAGHDLVLTKMGVGKVNAARAAQAVHDAVAPDAVICTGTAGALHDGLDVGDIVVARDCLQHDLRVDFLGVPPGQVPFTDLRVFRTSPTLLEAARAVELSGRTQHVGRVLTGDAFVEDAATREALHDDLGGDCVEMEGAAVGQVCTLNDIPFLLVRALSDRADGRSDIDFSSFLEDAAHASARLVLGLLDNVSPEATMEDLKEPERNRSRP